MSDVITDLKKILSDIRDKTGVEVRMAPRGSGEVKVSFEVRGEMREGWVDGEGESGERTARLVEYLLENADLRQFLPDKEEYLRTILLGEGNGWYVYRFMSKYNLPEGNCFAVCVETDRHTAEAVAHIERCIADTSDMVVRMDDNVCAVVRFSDDGQTPYDFAQFLYQSLYEEVGVKASMGVGGEVGTFAEISSSYHQAVTAVRMSAVFHGKGEVHSYKEYLLVKMLEEVPESRLKEYLEQLQIGDAREIFDDEEMVNTAEEFLQSSLNVSETSRNLFMHRNTLMYRLDKIERVTGLNIRKFSDAVSFRVITILYKLMQMN